MFNRWASRTIRNWRWWVVLPLVPIVLSLIAAQLLFLTLHWLISLPIRALDGTEQVSRAIFNWAKKGWTTPERAP